MSQARTSSKDIWIGSWQVSGWASSDARTLSEVLLHAFEQGVVWFDTAESYGNGEAEQVLGRTLGNKRNEIFLSSKFSHHHSEPRLIRKSLEKSLRRLHTDYLDVYFQHWPPKDTSLEESVGELVRLKEEGKIRAVGVSNWGVSEFSQIQNLERIDYLQNAYSLLWAHELTNVRDICAKHQIRFVAYSPLCHGLLARGPELMTNTPEDHRRENVLFSEDNFELVSELFKTLELLAAEHSCTPAAIAIQAALATEGIDAVILGASSTKQLDQNLAALSVSLDEEIVRELQGYAAKMVGSDARSLWDWRP